MGLVRQCPMIVLGCSLLFLEFSLCLLRRLSRYGRTEAKITGSSNPFSVSGLSEFISKSSFTSTIRPDDNNRIGSLQLLLSKADWYLCHYFVLVLIWE